MPVGVSIASTRTRLSAYLNLQNELRIQTERLMRKRESLGDVRSPGTDPGRSCRATGDEAMCRRIEEVEELEERVAHLLAAARTEGDILDRAISSLRVQDQREVLTMRYLDGMEWDDVVFCKHGGEVDFLAREEDYRQAVYSLHSRALASLSCVLSRVA